MDSNHASIVALDNRARGSIIGSPGTPLERDQGSGYVYYALRWYPTLVMLLCTSFAW